LFGGTILINTAQNLSAAIPGKKSYLGKHGFFFTGEKKKERKYDTGKSTIQRGRRVLRTGKKSLVKRGLETGIWGGRGGGKKLKML